MSPVRLVGSTSGAVTLDCPAVGGNNTLVLPTGNGNAGNVLSTNGSGALSWVQGGRILQVTQATYATQGSTTSTTYVNSGLEHTITPSSSSSKVLAIASFILGNAATQWNYVSLFRGSTNLAAGINASQPQFSGTYAQGVPDYHVPGSLMYLDSPATTSATTYYVKFRSQTGGTVRICTDGIPATIILMEVAA